ncbi:MAG TPA: UbiA family prenyltransferase [Hanamia sp.]
MGNQFSDNSIPLIVDLDGTFINTDLLYEGIVSLVKKKCLYIFLLLPWLMKGKAHLKNKVSGIAQINLELLPYNVELLEFLQKESDKGRKIILATASPMHYALEISKIHPIFNEVYGTNETNLKGKNKLKILIENFGEKKFDYIGNSNSDLIIFASSRYSYLVNASTSLKNNTKRISNLKSIWSSKKGFLFNLLKAIRPYQWVKNLLVFVPLITAHKFHSTHLILQTFYAFIAFSFVASSGYIINDLLDLNSDRSHPRKRFRPLASGQLSILSGIIFSLVLLSGGLYIATRLSFLFFIILFSYFIVSLSYSLFFKKAVLFDVFILALLYSIRVFAGGEVIGVELSFWLIAFSTLIFLSLAFVKRYSELMRLDNNSGLISRGREYFLEDLHLLQVMGIVSGFCSVIVFSLYIDSPEVAFLYSHPKALWSISLLFLFWINRIWLITIRGKMTDDPIIFAAKDITSYCIFFLVGLILFLSI